MLISVEGSYYENFNIFQGVFQFQLTFCTIEEQKLGFLEGVDDFLLVPSPKLNNKLDELVGLLVPLLVAMGDGSAADNESCVFWIGIIDIFILPPSEVDLV